MDVDMVAIQMPGRQSRIGESPLTDFEMLIDTIVSELISLPDKYKPTVFFGHSLGALVAFEVARKLQAKFPQAAPVSLVISGAAAPHCCRLDEPIHALPDDEFIEKLRAMNGTPAEIFDHPELLDLVMPTIRADFFLANSYRYNAQKYRSNEILTVPIHVFAGELDGYHDNSSSGISEAQILGWQLYTNVHPIRLNLFSGDHFFIHSNRAEVIAEINRILRATLDDLYPRGIY